MAILELSMVIGAIVEMSAEAVVKKLGRQEAIIRTLKHLKIESEPLADDFDALYAYALVEYGVFKPEPILNFFRNEFVRAAFRRSVYKNDPSILEKEAEGVIAWNEETSKLGRVDYDPRREFAAFTAVFNEIVNRTRTPAEVRQDQKLDDLHHRTNEILEKLEKLNTLDDIRSELDRLASSHFGMTACAQEQALIELYQISRQLVSLDKTNLQDVLQRIVRSASKALSADAVTLYTFNPDSQTFEQTFLSRNSLFHETLTTPDGVWRSSAPPSRFVEREGIKSFAGMRLQFGNEPLGVLFVNYRTPQSFTKEQRELIELFANQAAIAIKTLRFVEQTYETALSAESTRSQGLLFHSCFVSHSSKDENFAQKLYTDLQAKGVSCWFAPVDMRIGDRIRSRLDEMIRQYDKLLLILSRSSIASQWVEHEVEAALEKEREKKIVALLPIRLDDAIMKSKSGWAKYIRNTRHIGDFSNWQDHEFYDRSFGKLLNDLAKQ